jgi:hypothetical protein
MVYAGQYQRNPLYVHGLFLPIVAFYVVPNLERICADYLPLAYYAVER